jgi:hypothetical protein
MTIHWIQTQSDDVFATLDEIERAIAAGDTGAPPAGPPAIVDQDPYLTESLSIARASWSVDPNQIVTSSRPGLAGVINLFQRLVRRATWWYTLPQWLQASKFHGAVVRIIDVLLDRQRLLGIRIGQIESTNAPAHLFALEQQIQALRDEQRELRRRIQELEQTQSNNHAPR